MPPILSRAVLMLCLASPPGLPGAFPISRAFANQQAIESFESTETTVLREERPLTEKLPEAIADLDDSVPEAITSESLVEIPASLPEVIETTAADLPAAVEPVVTEEATAVVETAPAFVEEIPAVVEEATIASEAALPEVIDTPAVELPAAIEPVVVEEAPAVVEEIPVVVEEAPIATEATLPEVTDTPDAELPAAVEPVVVEEAPAVVEETPAVVEEIPAVVEEAPIATEATLPEVTDTPEADLPAAVEPDVVEETPVVVQETPAVVEEIPAVVEEAPIATEATLPEMTDTPAVELPAAVEPVVADEAPGVVEETPAVVGEIPTFESPESGLNAIDNAGLDAPADVVLELPIIDSVDPAFEGDNVIGCELPMVTVPAPEFAPEIDAPSAVIPEAPQTESIPLPPIGETELPVVIEESPAAPELPTDVNPEPATVIESVPQLDSNELDLVPADLFEAF